MKMKIQLVLLGTAMTLSACGGGGSSTTPVTVAPPTPVVVPTTKPTKAVGPISGFGSVIVNGVHYNTDNATFTINGETGTQDDLDVGKVIVIKATTDADGNSTATDVSYNDDVKGTITSIDTINNRMVVLGQTVIVDGNTSFDNQISPASLAGLNVGDKVEVSGESNANGDIVASRIEINNASSESNVRGTVSAHNEDTHTFEVNDLVVDYSQATLEGFDSNGVTDDLYVETIGTDTNNAGDLIATRVRFEGSEGRDNDHVGNENDEGELHGFVTVFTSSSDFKVANIAVITNSSTTYKYGQASDIAVNVRLEAEGKYNANGALIARKIKFENGNNDDGNGGNDGNGHGNKNGVNIKIESTLDAVDTSANTVTIFGTDFEVDTSTRYKDDSNANIRTFNVSNLNVGDYLEVKGYDRGGNMLYASKIERKNAKNKNELEAFADSIGTDNLVLLGVSVSTTANTRYQDANENNISQSAFFNQVIVGDLIKAEGTKTSSTALSATKLSIKRPDNDD